MFFESPRQYKCKVEPSQVFGCKSKQVDNYIGLCPREPDYYHGEKSAASPMTTAFTVPKPAPRKSRNNQQQSSQQYYNSRHLTSTRPPTQSSLTRQQPITLKHRREYNFLMNNYNKLNPTTASAGNQHKLFDGSSKQQAAQYLQTSEETNDSTSDDDTEDSIDNPKHDKPKVSY